jgi:hypothetical protein
VSVSFLFDFEESNRVEHERDFAEVKYYGKEFSQIKISVASVNVIKM